MKEWQRFPEKFAISVDSLATTLRNYPKMRLTYVCPSEERVVEAFTLLASRHPDTLKLQDNLTWMVPK